MSGENRILVMDFSLDLIIEMIEFRFEVLVDFLSFRWVGWIRRLLGYGVRWCF